MKLFTLLGLTRREDPYAQQKSTGGKSSNGATSSSASISIYKLTELTRLFYSSNRRHQFETDLLKIGFFIGYITVALLVLFKYYITKFTACPAASFNYRLYFPIRVLMLHLCIVFGIRD